MFVLSFCRFYFICLALLSFLSISHRIAFIASETYRKFWLRMLCEMPSEIVQRLNFDYGDCFFALQLSSNVNPYLLTEFFHDHHSYKRKARGEQKPSAPSLTTVEDFKFRSSHKSL